MKNEMNTISEKFSNGIRAKWVTAKYFIDFADYSVVIPPIEVIRRNYFGNDEALDAREMLLVK